MKYSLIILIVMTFGFLSCKKQETPQTSGPAYQLKAQANVPQFNSDNAYQQVDKQVSFGPRNPNSPAHEEALNYFKSEFGKYADSVILQSFPYQGYNEELHLTNVIAKFKPQAKNRIFISAHWDSRPRADQDKDPAKKNLPIPGANDGASGAGILLELARILKSNPVDYGVDLILFDGEDYGKEGSLDNYFLGSKYFATQRPSDYNPAFGILLDLVGDKEAVFTKEGNSRLYAPDVTDMIWNLAKKINATDFVDQDGPSIEDDHIPLNQSGLTTVDIIDIDLVGANTSNPRRKYWHTQADNMQNISKETLKQVGDVLLQLIYSLQFSKPTA